MPAINKPKLVDEIIGAISEQLMSGELKRGQKMPSEIELAKQFNVGRNSVREAFRVLKALGIVEIRQGTGTYIANEVSEICLNPLVMALMVQTGTPMSLVELRQLLEVGIIELVVSRVTDEDLEAIYKTITDFEQVVQAQSSPQKLLEYDMQFHYALLEATKNPMIEKIGKTIMQLFGLSIKEHLSEISRANSAVQNHRLVYNAIKNRDVDDAKGQVLKSFQVWQTYVRVP